MRLFPSGIFPVFVGIHKCHVSSKCQHLDEGQIYLESSVNLHLTSARWVTAVLYLNDWACAWYLGLRLTWERYHCVSVLLVTCLAKLNLWSKYLGAQICFLIIDFYIFLCWKTEMILFWPHASWPAQSSKDISIVRLRTVCLFTHYIPYLLDKLEVRYK